jgi:hypothetical protein
MLKTCGSYRNHGSKRELSAQHRVEVQAVLSDHSRFVRRAMVTGVEENIAVLRLSRL